MRTHDLLQQLGSTYAGSFDAVTLQAELTRTLEVFGHAPGAEVDQLVAGYLQDRLRAIVAGRGLIGSATPTVLFVCVHNAGRSQMAASFLRDLAPGVTVLSAGSRPRAVVNPVVVQAMAEVGLDLSGATPTALTRESVQRADLAVTMGCGDACPVLPGTTYLDWELRDPAGQPLEVVRQVRDDVRRHVEALVAGMLQPGSYVR
ncbi:MAG: arsenate reductase ArsC [Mycobacteriales bacterium]